MEADAFDPDCSTLVMIDRISLTIDVTLFGPYLLHAAAQEKDPPMYVKHDDDRCQEPH